MNSFSADIIVKALDGLAARAEVIAQNIANGGTPGYRPLRLSFEQALAGAASQGPDAVRAVIPRIERSADDGPLRMDLELATASSTALRYGALVDLLNRQMQIQSLAITGSR